MHPVAPALAPAPPAVRSPEPSPAPADRTPALPVAGATRVESGADSPEGVGYNAGGVEAERS